MKRNIIIIGLLFLLASIWWLSRSKWQASSPQIQSTNNDSNNAAVMPPPVFNQPQTNPDTLTGFKAAFATPINLYGRVIDQYGDPVTSATVEYSVLSLTGKQKQQTTSKSDGSFEITGYHGGTLAVDVSKTGYRKLPGADDKVGSGKLFYFGLGHPPASSPQAQVMFTLQKPGTIEPLIHIEERNYRLSRDGSPTEINLRSDGKGTHRVVVRCWNMDLAPRPQGEQRYYWRFEIEVPGGGIIERKDSMTFEAPTTGYEPRATIEMPVDAKPSWNGSAQRSYFIHFDDNLFARVNIEVIAGGDHFVVWESHLNPKLGSRNLDTDPGQR